MKGYPDAGQNPVGTVRDTDEATMRLAASGLARRARDEHWTKQEIEDVAAALGIVQTVSPATTNANTGKTMYPDIQQKRREREREYKRNTRRKDSA